MDVLTCVEASASSKCFDWSKMAAEVLPVAHTDEYSKSGEPAIHVLRSGVSASDETPPTTDIYILYMVMFFNLGTYKRWICYISTP